MPFVAWLTGIIDGNILEVRIEKNQTSILLGAEKIAFTFLPFVAWLTDRPYTKWKYKKYKKLREKNIVQEIGEKDTKMIITPYKE